MKIIFCITLLLATALLTTGTMAMAQCWDSKMACVKITARGNVYDDTGIMDVVGNITVNNCWNKFSCQLCGGWAGAVEQCSSRFVACYGDKCAACYAPVSGTSDPPMRCHDKNGNNLSR